MNIQRCIGGGFLVASLLVCGSKAWARVYLPGELQPPTAEISTENTFEAPPANFGNYRIHLGASRVDFDGGLPCYDRLYGSTSPMYSMGVDWFPSAWAPPFLAIGLGARAHVYRDSGFASLQESGCAPEKTRPTSFTALPMQAGVVAQATLLKQKWLVVEGWSLLERAYFQEVRGAGSGAGHLSPWMASTSGQSAAADDTILANSGWKTAIANGIAVNVMLNFLDEESIRSGRGTLGLGYIYLKIYTEVVTDTTGKGIGLGRRHQGVAFTFETVH